MSKDKYLRGPDGRFAKKPIALKTTLKVVKPKVNKIKTTLDIVVIDASSSMSVYLSQTIKGFNEYINTINQSIKKGITPYLSVYSFDYITKNIVLNQNLNVKPFVLSAINYKPSGMTALNDAIMQATLGLEFEDLTARPVTVTIFTDGEENASKNYSIRDVAERIKQLKSLGITVVFVGTGGKDYENTISKTYNIEVSNILNYKDNEKGRVSAMNLMSASRGAKTEEYSRGISKSIGFFSKDKS